MLESMPQFCTNLASITMRNWFFPRTKTSAVQKMSTITSCATTVFSIVTWIASSNKKEFVYRSRNSEKVHSWASLCAIFLCIGCMLTTAVTSMVYYPAIGGNFYMLIPTTCNILDFIFTIAVIAIPWSWGRSSWWRFLRTLVHLMLMIVSICYVANWLLFSEWLLKIISYRSQYLLLLNIICLMTQLFLGVMILARIRIAALRFQPMISRLFLLLKFVCFCETLNEKIQQLEREDEEEVCEQVQEIEMLIQNNAMKMEEEESELSR